MWNEISERDPDIVLAEQARRGDPAAFEELAMRWWTPVYRIAWIMSGSASGAAELTEEVLSLAICRSEPLPRFGARFKTFLYRLAFRCMLGRRSRRAWPGVPSLRFDAAGRLAWPAGGGSTSGPRETTDPAAKIREGLGQLDDLDRAALLLRDIEELPLDEAADILGAPSEEIRLRVHRARVVLTCVLGQPLGSVRSSATGADC